MKLLHKIPSSRLANSLISNVCQDDYQPTSPWDLKIEKTEKIKIIFHGSMELNLDNQGNYKVGDNELAWAQINPGGNEMPNNNLESLENNRDIWGTIEGLFKSIDRVKEVKIQKGPDNKYAKLTIFVLMPVYDSGLMREIIEIEFKADDLAEQENIMLEYLIAPLPHIEIN